MFRASRRRREGEDRFLAWKVRLFAAGAAAAFAGMATSRPWLVWTGIAILAVAVVLRLLPAGD